MRYQEASLVRDEDNRPTTTLEGGQVLPPVIDRALACLAVDLALAQRHCMVVAGCPPEECSPGRLKNHGLRVEDIDLWALNEAFACQAIYCRDHLGIDPAKYNVNGGGISIGHPYGMTGARYVVTSMCVDGGMGAAALFEVA